MNVKGKKITLRAIELEDLEVLHKWANDPVLQDIMGDIHPPSSLNFHQRWLEKIDGDNNNYRLAIESAADGLIGMSTIIQVDWRNRHAWHGIYLGDKNIQGKGYGLDVVMTTMRYAFDELQLERLDGSMIEYNEGSVRFYCEKLGWSVEGRKNNYFYRRGKFWDQIIVGITKDDYQELISKTNYWKNEK